MPRSGCGSSSREGESATHLSRVDGRASRVGEAEGDLERRVVGSATSFDIGTRQGSETHRGAGGDVDVPGVRVGRSRRLEGLEELQGGIVRVRTWRQKADR